MTKNKTNTGDYNLGNYNSGDGNLGDCNSGNQNLGNCNSGPRNLGDCNSGSLNSGYYNSGNCNSGSLNSGHGNSGNYNLGNYNSGHFNTDEPTVRMFNKDTGLKRSELSLPHIYLPVTEWVPDRNMTDEQKASDPDFYIKSGTLIKRSYKEAWAIAWQKLNEESKQLFLDLPNFDADIFMEITGVDVRAEKQSFDGKVVEIDGKKYRLLEEK